MFGLESIFSGVLGALPDTFISVILSFLTTLLNSVLSGLLPGA